MILAKDAKRNAENFSSQSELDEIYQQIERISLHGVTFLYSGKYLIESDIKALESNGYTIRISEVNKCHRIEW